jgi:DNA-binding NarL/FixJ family response regulator
MVAAQRIRVLLVDDHTMVRQGLRNVLQAYPNIEIVGEAGNGEEAVSSVAKLQPTVVVMDIMMKKMDGIAATRLIKTNYPDIAVLGLTITPHTYHLEAMLKAGAFEVVTKDNAIHELYNAIQRAVAAIQPVLILQDAPISEKPPGALEKASNQPKDPLPIQQSDGPEGEDNTTQAG